jgi:hypothetical protein
MSHRQSLQSFIEKLLEVWQLKNSDQRRIRVIFYFLKQRKCNSVYIRIIQYGQDLLGLFYLSLLLDFPFNFTWKTRSLFYNKTYKQVYVYFT